MVDVGDAVRRSGAPTDRPRELLDARDLPPPKPLQQTLERLADLDPAAVLVQVNDRAPQHLFPRLEDRDFEHETVAVGDAVATLVWREG